MMGEPQDDQMLIDRISRGDPAAEDELYLAHRDYAIRIAVARGAQQCDAEDYVQEAFIRVLRFLRRGARPTGAFRPYLNAAVRNVSADVHRRRGSREFPSSDGSVLFESACGREPQDEIEIRTLVQLAMTTLPLTAREMLWRLHVEGQPISVVAGEAGVTAQTMAARASRARRTLRRAIGH